MESNVVTSKQDPILMSRIIFQEIWDSNPPYSIGRRILNDPPNLSKYMSTRYVMKLLDEVNNPNDYSPYDAINMIAVGVCLTYTNIIAQYEDLSDGKDIDILDICLSIIVETFMQINCDKLHFSKYADSIIEYVESNLTELAVDYHSRFENSKRISWQDPISVDWIPATIKITNKIIFDVGSRILYGRNNIPMDKNTFWNTVRKTSKRESIRAISSLYKS